MGPPTKLSLPNKKAEFSGGGGGGGDTKSSKKENFGGSPPLNFPYQMRRRSFVGGGATKSSLPNKKRNFRHLV